MAYVITDACAKCGSCADNCPLGIITEGDDKYVIDADQCVECGACSAVCPQSIDIPTMLRAALADSQKNNG